MPQMLPLVFRPGLDELVHGADVMNDDLVCWVHVLVAVNISYVASRMLWAQMLGQCMSKCCTVSESEALAFNAPDSHWLYATSV